MVELKPDLLSQVTQLVHGQIEIHVRSKTSYLALRGPPGRRLAIGYCSAAGFTEAEICVYIISNFKLIAIFPSKI